MLTNHLPANKIRLDSAPTGANKCWRNIIKGEEIIRAALNTPGIQAGFTEAGSAGAVLLSFGLTAVGEFEREDAALVQVELVLVRLGVVQHLHVAALHAHGEPLAGGTVAQREDLHPRKQHS